jgi:hypothetical protein
MNARVFECLLIPATTGLLYNFITSHGITVFTFGLQWPGRGGSSGSAVIRDYQAVPVRGGVASFIHRHPAAGMEGFRIRSRRYFAADRLKFARVEPEKSGGIKTARFTACQ